MPSDPTKFQRLSDEQVARRLSTYGEGGAFEAGMQLLWANARDIIEDTTRQFFGDAAVPLVAGRPPGFQRLGSLEQLASLTNRPAESAMASQRLADVREAAALQQIVSLGGRVPFDPNLAGPA